MTDASPVTNMPSLPDVLSTVILGPGDRLVLVIPDLDYAGLDRAKEVAKAAGLEGRVLFVSRVQHLAVLRGDAPAEYITP